jgi:AcrR family transcriptional regulator
VKAKKSEQTREKLFASALALFRKRGFDGASMRDIAKAAGLSLGAAYYYFPSKEAIVLAYYARLQEETATLERQQLAKAVALRDRLDVVFSVKLAAVRRDRKILAALTRLVADPDAAVSLFARETKSVREASIAGFAAAVQPELAMLPESARRLLPAALWALYLAILLYYFHDKSPKQKNTDTLMSEALDLVATVVPLCSMPFAAPFLDRLAGAMTKLAL